MRLSGFLVVALTAVPSVLAKSYIVTFPEEAGRDVVEKAMADIKKEGGKITHEYTIIKYVQQYWRV